MTFKPNKSKKSEKKLVWSTPSETYKKWQKVRRHCNSSDWDRTDRCFKLMVKYKA